MRMPPPSAYSDLAQASVAGRCAVGFVRRTASCRRSARLLSRDPKVDLFFQDRQRKRAGTKHLRVEFPNVELRPKRGLCFVTQTLDGQRSNLVGDRLAGDRDVALDLRG